MGRTERNNALRKKGRKKIIQALFFVLLLIICFIFLYFLNIFPFRSDILAQDRLNILAVGTDSVETKGRADTILILSVAPKNKDTLLFSIPRDIRVMIPDRGMDKINHAFAYGGIDLLEKTIEEFMGISIHYYGIVDFEGFSYIIDALNGVDIFVEKDMYYIDRAGSLRINLRSGQQILNGEKALEYVRFRSDAMGDLGRIQRQQKLINAVIEKILNFESMAKIPTIINNLTDYIKTNMNPNELIALARLMKDVDRTKIWVETIQGDPQYIDGVSYLVADDNDVKKRVQNLIENKYRGFNIEVLNGNRMPGSAHRVANKIKELGFNIVNIDNADHFDYQKTVLIIYSKDLKLENYVTQFFNDIEIIRKEQPYNGLDMTIIVGKNMVY
ncbi:MAG: LCP family protein [Atribacterota bacterium]|nr:LCP family protein [Atribacterota bacterium]MDD5636459.1 LCP family protein [Atribacterota bacterium]